MSEVKKTKELEPVVPNKKRPNSAGKFTSLWEEPGKLRKINFVVASSTSEDEGYPAAGLNYQAPDARGWQSARFCLYPQTLVLHLEERVCIRKLQFLSHSIFIPETMEVEIGDVPTDLEVVAENASYAKAGTLKFDTNEKSEYKAREFKTVNLEAIGTFIRLIVHKNYDNRLNKFNQVGLLGINVIGHGPQEEFKPQDAKEASKRGTSASENLSIGMDKDLTSAYDDLAYNMYMDPEVVELGRKLERRKQVAVRVERYEYARKLKNTQTALKLVGLKMGAMEMEKRIYMDNGQYDKAKARAKQKAELRDEAYAKLDIDTLLETNGPNPKNDELETKELAPAKKKKEKPKSPEPPKENIAPAPTPPQQPLPPPRTAPMPPPLPPKPAFMRETEKEGPDRIYLSEEMRDNMVQSPEPRDSSPPPLPPKTAKREDSPPIRVMPVPQPEPEPEPDPDPDPEPEMDLDPDEDQEFEEDEEEGEVELETEHVEERRLPTRYQSYDDRRVTAAVGGGMMALTKTKSYPSRAMHDEDIDRAIGKLTEAQKKEAALPIEVFGIKTVSKVYDKQFNTKEMGFKEVKAYLESYKHEKGKPKAGEVMRAATMVLQKALKDNVMGIFYIGTEIMGILYGPFLDKNTVSKNDLAISLDKIYPDVSSKLTSTVPRQQSLAQQAIFQAGMHPQVATTGVISRALTKPFPKNAHSQGGQCRAEMVEQLMDTLGVQKAKDSGMSAGELMGFASSGIQQPSESIRKPCERIYVRLYRSHPKLVRKYLPIDENSARKNPSYRTLLAEFKQIDEQGTGGGPATKPADHLLPPQFDDRDISRRNSYKSPAGGSGRPSQKKSIQNDEVTCLFCGESSPEFVGEKINAHYWKTCPMLTLCEHCKQVIEVSAIATHLLGECPASNRYKRCQYCGEAVKKKDYDAHMQIKPHPIVPPATQGNHCPLCHQNIGPWEDGWRAHLLGPNSCPAHIRKPSQGLKTGRTDELYSPPGSSTLSVDSGYQPGRASRFPSITPSETASVSSYRSNTSVTKYSTAYGNRNLPKIEPTAQRQRHQSEGPPPTRKSTTTGPTGIKAPQRRSVSEAPATARKKSKPWDRRTAW